jgi:epidermal growth factor receptor
MCGKCHAECKKSCKNSGADSCDSCVNIKNGPVCVVACPLGKHNVNGDCQPCDDTCDRNHHDEQNNQIDDQFKYMKIVIIFVFVVSPVTIICVLLLLILICYRKAQKARNERIQMSLLAGLEDTVPLCQTGASPNMRSIRIIKEAEIRKGGVLGTGEFGQVLKGLWMPEKEKYKIPIAIKSFKNMVDSESSAEFMAEAQIMASLDHPHILKLMAICLANELMMITQLMPLGNLLGYVRMHRDKIDSKTMMNWFVQIAQGMTYLEGRRLVHRDLAARNVLVHTPTSVRIADFGMTKLLKHGTVAYKSADEKVAWRWLAPECMYHKVFTSKSDVWAFGVTVWEVLTYGTIPYMETKSRDVPILVTAGEKLSQPEICSLEFYTLLLLCWNLNPELRPHFNDLTKDLTEIASDPARYLVIAGDKLMRLPELTKKGSVSLYADLAKLDCGDAEIVEAERYVDLLPYRPGPPVGTDNYLLPNPPCDSSNEPNYLQMGGNRSAETATIQIPEKEAATANGYAQYTNIEAASEPGHQVTNNLVQNFMNLIRNQGNFAYNRVRYFKSSRP